MSKFYISTAIAYASSKPHIGNTYEIILADSIARYQRLIGNDVYFQTGTDEHGEKVQNKATEKGVTPQQYVDELQKEVKRIWDLVDSSYDRFVRTTDAHHKDRVSKIFTKLYNQGDIYKGEYNGWYCTPCESFYTETQLVDGKCPDCGRAVNMASEEAYFFKMSKYAERLIEYINCNPKFLLPESRKNEMLNGILKDGLQDLCVSRSSFSWGVPVSFDNRHVVYVWIDALSNYITFLGYNPEGDSEDEFKKLWPADLQLIGKDIYKFHAIYWPIILMALDLPLPTTIFGHPWILMDGGKMSKSTGQVLYADDLVNNFGVDALRYFVLSEIPFSNDGVISNELIIDKTNADLVNILGNLLNRTVAMTHKYFDGVIVKGNTFQDLDKELIASAYESKNKVDSNMKEYHVSRALEAIFELLRKANKYVDETTPWILAKDDASRDRLATVLYNLLETIRYAAVLLQPYIPASAAKIFVQLNSPLCNYDSLEEFGKLLPGTKLPIANILFERIDKSEKLKELNTNE